MIVLKLGAGRKLGAREEFDQIDYIIYARDY
jgi:hypothetical protein